MNESIKQEKSYGIIPVYTKSSQPLFLLVKHNKGHWAFPKGHIEKGESPIQTAKRELFEEVAIEARDINIIEGITFTENYSFTKDNQKIGKTNGYFIGITDNMMEVKILKKEISEYKWAEYETALQTITFDKSKEILREALRYLNTHNVFNPKTKKIKNIAKNKQKVIIQLESIFDKKTNVYIDYANVRPWSEKLGWHIDLKRLKQFLDSFNTIKAINFYSGYIEGDEHSEKEKIEIERNKYILRTKPVKIMRFSIDASSIPNDSTALLDQFIKRSLLRRYEVSTVEFLNNRFKDMNTKSEYFIEDRKCNFDVEIGVDMLIDCERDSAETFILWSGDSDFADPVEKLISSGKKVVLFATARRVSKELSALRDEGLLIFDIQKIRDFICWNRETKRKRDPNKGTPKL